MSDALTLDIFAEDRAHEAFLKPLIVRLARELGRDVTVRVRSARGGHGKAIAELRTYQHSIVQGIGGGVPDILVAAIDANCAAFASKRNEIDGALLPEFEHTCVRACPDPHIERWYLADLQSFHEIVGMTPKVPASKCGRDFYKEILSRAVIDAGHPATLGGVEFAAELAEAMDLYRAGECESSLKHFVDELQGKLQQP